MEHQGELNILRLRGIRLLAGIAWLATLVIVGGSPWGEGGLLPVMLAVGLSIYPTVVALRGINDAATRTVLGATMPLYCALLLFQWSGHGWQGDLHMTFFAMLAVIAALADWRPLVAGAAVTAAHHLVFDVVAPDLVFQGGSDFARVMLHAVILVVEAGALVVLANQLETLLLAQVAARNARRQMEEDAERERARVDAEQQQVVREIAAGLKSLAAGDLTCTIASRFAPQFEALREDFNDAVASLDSLVGRVVESSAQISGSAGEIRMASDDLARRTEIQAESLEQATRRVAGLVEGVTAAARHAGEATATLRSSQERAENGHEIVARAMETMERIERSAGEIGQIISLIDGIAFQTNLLALNAGVEAARAGESGKGFAVVANEVRSLAQRSAEAAKDIKELIATSTAQVSEGVDLVTRTGTVLQDMKRDVTTITDMVADLALAARSNADELGRVGEAFDGIDRATQQNAAMAEESNAALRSLGAETAALMNAVERFRASAGAVARMRMAA